MDGLIFVAGLIAGVTVVALRSRDPSAMPGVILTLALVAGSFWYVFA
jgi:hypothetical protein